jgi:hypothetical protein
MRLKRNEFLGWSAVLCCSFVCGIYLLARIGFGHTYSSMAFLPFVFALCTVLFASVYTQLGSNIGLLCLHCLMIIRLVVTPFFMVQAGFQSHIKGITQQEVEKAVVLLSYECLAMYFVLSRLTAKSKKQILSGQLQTKEYAISYDKPNGLFTLVLFALGIYCLVVWFILPSSRDLYKTVFDIANEDFTTVLYSAAQENVGSLKRAMLTLFKMVFDIVRILLPMYFLIFLKRRGAPLRMSITTGLLLAGVQFLFIDSTTAKSIISAFLLISFLARLYPVQSKRIVNIAALIATAAIVAYFLVRFLVGSRYGDDSTEYVSKILNAYFGGVDNVAAGMNMPEGYAAATFWGGLYSAIPFNSSLFGLRVEHLQTLYNDINGSYGQIPPMIIEGEYYFGVLLAPLVPCLCASAAYHYGEKFSHTSSAWHLVSNLFASVLFAVSIVMYNQEILLSWLTNWLLPMGILSWLAERERVRKNTRYETGI